MALEKVKITLECGHASMLRVRTTPEGYTHDWELYVRGADNTDISHYVEKVVFHLHETFPKPKRILKEPPYEVKESGYAGFMIPIDIWLKNKDEPKRIQIQYDLHLQQRGPAINNVTRYTEVFTSPGDDFRKKLLKGGGVIMSNVDEGHDRSESKSLVPMVSKPKLSGSESKKHRTEPKSSNDFDDIFGDSIKIAKVSPENKKSSVDKTYHKPLPYKSEKTEKMNKSKHSPHKDSKREKNGEEKKDKKNKEASKEKERSKEKSKRPPSPGSKSSYQSPSSKRPSSPVAVKKQLSPLGSISTPKSSSPKIREKEHKKVVNDKDKEREKEKSKESIKGSSEELKNDKKKKKHKDDKSTERKDKIRDKDRDKIKEMKNLEKKIVEKSEKHEKSDKKKVQETSKSSKDLKKSPRPVKEGDRSSSKSRSEKIEVTEKVKDVKSDKDRQKHKHKKKEKKERSDESKERDKRDKRDKQKNNVEKGGGGSSNSVAQSNSLSTHLSEVPDRDSSDSANSADEEESKLSSRIKMEQELARNHTSENRPPRSLSPSGSEHAKREPTEKIKKEKLKPLRNEERESSRKRKKRSSSKGDDEIPVKREKDTGFSPPLEPVSSSQSPVTVEMAAAYNVKPESDEVEAIHPKQDFEAESEQIAPDSTNSVLIESENDEPPVFSEDYVSQLKDLQQKIMTLQDNQELQRVVQVIAATGQYEITRKTFDFDLCALDRRTVQRLQQFFSAS
ncbi:protein AF-9 [Chelonus insularis]|uniref:protein AF-9 n=1 Tax=Chelonus insularis TaxID=460826 RepID=UPI00158AC4D8|nr:protein AF-9 [Chelonus insularis]